MNPTTTDSLTDLTRQLMDEGLIGLGIAARLIGEFNNGKPTHPSTLMRWIAKGVRLRSGGLLKLSAIAVSGRWCTSRPALIRFLAAQQEQQPTATDAIPPSHAARKKVAEAAGSELEKLGV